MNVTLREITQDTVRAVCKLAVRPDQNSFVAPNAVSLAEALFSDEAWYRAIYADDDLAGFLMLADETLRPNPPEKPSIGLWRLMIDGKHQHRGIGRDAMRLIIEHVRTRPNVERLLTSYVPGDGCPEPFYRSLGFVPTGEVDGGEVVLSFPLRDTSI